MGKRSRLKTRRSAGCVVNSVRPADLADCGNSLRPQDAAIGNIENPRRFRGLPKWKKATEGFFHGQLGQGNSAVRTQWPSDQWDQYSSRSIREFCTAFAFTSVPHRTGETLTVPVDQSRHITTWAGAQFKKTIRSLTLSQGGKIIPPVIAIIAVIGAIPATAATNRVIGIVIACLILGHGPVPI